MRGFETISTTRWNGRGPDSSLERLWVFVWIHVYTVAALWTVTHFPCLLKLLNFEYTDQKRKLSGGVLGLGVRRDVITPPNPVPAPHHHVLALSDRS